jgi:hypothetical protein
MSEPTLADVIQMMKDMQTDIARLKEKSDASSSSGGRTDAPRDLYRPPRFQKLDFPRYMASQILSSSSTGVNHTFASNVPWGKKGCGWPRIISRASHNIGSSNSRTTEGRLRGVASRSCSIYGSALLFGRRRCSNSLSAAAPDPLRTTPTGSRSCSHEREGWTSPSASNTSPGGSCHHSVTRCGSTSRRHWRPP